jgi:predicted transcriptional regulator
MAIRARQLTVKLPFGLGSITFEPNEAEEKAAWEMFVELETRIATQPLDPDHGLLREALTSLYKLFGITREILRKYGPDVANGPESVGALSIRILNFGLREFTAKWHPRLLEHEELKPADVSAVVHERAWQHHDEMRRELEEKQEGLRIYADALAKIAGARLPDDDKQQ